ncbi:hypothetical protein ACEZHJ_04070 [Arhodomonas sp. KWT2]|uniref:hypothetical protein n=1 Tax=Arhodomonas sp. KWT TaxID=2679915 RepID=UPI0013CFB47B|nr:hypothetical protein [Arhodomonas sp. KWT]
MSQKIHMVDVSGFRRLKARRRMQKLIRNNTKGIRRMGRDAKRPASGGERKCDFSNA